MAKRRSVSAHDDVDAETAEAYFDAVRQGMSFEECLNHDEIRSALAADLRSDHSPWTVEDILERVFRDRRHKRGVPETAARFGHVELSDSLRQRIEAAAVSFREEHEGRTIEKLLIGESTRNAFTEILRGLGTTDRELATARRVAQNLFKSPGRLNAAREAVESASRRPAPAQSASESIQPDLDALEARLLELAGGSPDMAQGVRHVFRLLRARDGQAAFREAVLGAYGGECAITGCRVPEVIEAAHIEPFDGPATHRPGNGIPLRRDLHSLFDADLLGIDPRDGIVHLHPDIAATDDYADLEGKALSRPVHAAAAPEVPALAKRWRQFRERCSMPLKG
jgi:hypothetical protein